MSVRGNAATSGGKVLRVLLVEDSATDRELVERAFREPAPLAGPVHLEVVTDAEAALAAVREATFAIVLTDYSLPGRNGIELLRALRETDDETPVVLMTGLGDEFVAVAALQQGAADYVVKEIGFDNEKANHPAETPVNCVPSDSFRVRQPLHAPDPTPWSRAKELLLPAAAGVTVRARPTRPVSE